MATPLPPQSIVRVTVKCELNGQILLNISDYRTGLTTVPDYRTELTALVAAIRAGGGWLTEYKACLSKDLLIRSVIAQPIYPTRLVPVEVLVVEEGTVDEFAFPQNCALVVDKQSDIAQPWGRGSIHLGGIPLTFVAGGSITAAASTALTAFCLKFKLALTGGIATFFPVLFNLKDATRVTPWNVSTFRVTSRVMRRRTVGVGI